MQSSTILVGRNGNYLRDASRIQEEREREISPDFGTIPKLRGR